MTDATRRAGSPDSAGPRVGRGLGPTRRTLLLWAVGGIAGVGLTVSSAAALRTTADLAAELRGRTVPVTSALATAAEESSDGQVAFLLSLESDDPAVASAALVAAEAHGRNQATAWDAYLQYADGGPDELLLQDAYATAVAESRALATQLIALPPGDPTRPSLLADEKEQSAAADEALSSIQTTVYDDRVIEQTTEVEREVRTARTDSLQARAAAGLLFTAVALVLLRGSRRDERTFSSEANELRLSGQAAALEGSLQRGLEMSPTEESAYGIVHRALMMVAPDVPTELLVADSSQAHFHQALATSATPEHSCSVPGPSQCPAARAAQTWEFHDSSSLDACPYLRENEEPVWATCVPVSIGGRAIGVVHAQRRLDQPRPDRLSSDLELVARKTGDRIGAVRVLARSEAEAQVDPLTGLPNRRTLENQVSELRVTEEAFVVAFADLDHFKGINDAHGHDTGDRALRLFARVLRESVRPRDLVARFGGEEFVIVLPACSIDDAREVADRIRSELARVLQNATVPAFTVTIGLAAAEPGDQLSDVTAHADAAMLRGKSLGRDRVLVVGDPAPDSPARPVAVPHAS